MRRALAVSLVLVMALVLAPQGASAAKFRFTHGVASGDVKNKSALLSARTNQKAAVVAEVSKTRKFANIVKTKKVTALKKNNFTVEVNIKGLAAGTRYFYRFVGPGGKRSPVGTFRTAGSGDFDLVWTGDSDLTKGAGNFRSDVAAVLDSARREKPELFVWLGDTIYADSDVAASPASTLAQYRKKYREQRSLAEVRKMLAAAPVVAVWDDHEVVNDYAADGDSATPTPFSPDNPTLSVGQVNRGQRAFRDYFPVRETGGQHYRRLRRGPVELFVLDTRTFRTSPLPVLAACDINPDPAVIDPDLVPTLPQAVRDQFVALVPSLANPVAQACLDAINDPTRTMLGAAQKQWLKDGLQASNAPMKVIVSSVPIMEFFTFPYDRWEGYAAERLEILNFITDAANNVSGNVAFMAADTHATLAHDVCTTTFPVCVDTGMDEVVVGPAGTDTFGAQIDEVVGIPGANAQVAGFFLGTIGMDCVNLNQTSYGLLETDSAAGTLTMTPRAPTAGAVGTDICPAPIVIGP